MSINPESQYPGKIEPASPEFPYGKARNITLPSDGTGTPWEAALVNDIFGYQQSLLSDAGMVPTGTPDEVGASQYIDANYYLMGRVVANKAEAVLLDPEIHRNVFINAKDGGQFKAVIGAAPGTYSNDDPIYCGRVIIPTGGDGSKALIQNSDVTTPEMYGASQAIDDNAAFQSMFNASTSGDTISCYETYSITDRIYIDGKNLTIHFNASLTNLAGDSSGFVIVGTVTFFRIYGGKFVGDGVNRDIFADAFYASIVFGVGPLPSYAATISNVVIDGIDCSNTNVGVRCFGTRGTYNGGTGEWDGRIETENCKCVNSTFTDMIGFVGGFGYGLQFSVAKGGESGFNTFKRTGRHGVYFAEGDNYTSIGDQFFDHRVDGDPGQLRAALAMSRGQNMVAIAPRFYNCFNALGIGPEAAYYPTENILVDSPVFYDCQLKYMVIGNPSPSIHGTAKNVKIVNAQLFQRDVVSTNNMIVIYNGDGVYLENISIEDVSGSVSRLIFINGADGDAYTNDVRITGKLKHDSGTGIFVLDPIALGESRVFIDIDSECATTDVEFQTTPTNPNMKTIVSNKSRTFNAAGVAVGTTTSKVKTTTASNNSIPNQTDSQSSQLITKAATDDLWNLSTQVTAAGEFKKIALCLNKSGVAFIVAGIVNASSIDARLPNIADPRLVVVGVIELQPSYAGGSLTTNGAKFYDIIGEYE